LAVEKERTEDDREYGSGKEESSFVVQRDESTLPLAVIPRKALRLLLFLTTDKRRVAKRKSCGRRGDDMGKR
jgi:hypothetical protein